MQGRLLLFFSILIGIYSYIIFFLGIFRLLSEFYITVVTLFFVLVLLFVFKSSFLKIGEIFNLLRKNFLASIFISLFVIVNLMGALGPELGFDALWYHLTLPKLYLERGLIEFIPGGLLYYSVMPKLIDLLYVPALFFGNEITASFMHLLFGLLSTVVTYKIARLFINKNLSLLAAVLFYSNLIVGWMSITAYIDLGRTFFTISSIYFFILYFKERSLRYLLATAILVGFEIATKLLGFTTLISIVVTIILFFNHIDLPERLKNSLVFILISVLIVSPWLIFSYINTGSPVHPFFSDIYPSGISLESFNPVIIIQDIVNLFLFSADPISPIYVLSIPFVVIFYRKMPKGLKILLYIFLVNLFIWNFIPQKNARFILPYLPIISIISVWTITKLNNIRIKKAFVFFIFLSFAINLSYRAIANAKYIPYLLGVQAKQEFLLNNLNFNFGDYVDRDEKVKNIVGNNTVLINNIHNLYYINFPFEHESWAEEKSYRYILSKDALEEDRNYDLIYRDDITHTYLYEKNN